MSTPAVLSVKPPKVRRSYRNQPVLVQSVAAAGGEGPANKIEKVRPAESVLALEMLLSGNTADEIREKTGISWNMLIGLKARHATALEVRRQQMATDGWEIAEGLRFLMKKKMAMLADDDAALSKTSLKDLAVAKAVEQDKAFAALGEKQVSVIEHRTGPSIADFQKAIAEARQNMVKEAVPVEAVVVPAESSQ